MSKKLWGGRFEKEIDKDFFEFQKSIGCDYKLAEYDIHHSLIHIAALNKSGFLNSNEYAKLASKLNDVLVEIQGMDAKKWQAILKSENMQGIEDVHTYIQNKVEENLGPRFKSLALKLHTLRSRNDQIVFDEKYYCLEKSRSIRESLSSVRKSIFFLREKYKSQYFIGYTHTQRAQRILFPAYLYAYSQMFIRDSERLSKFYSGLSIYIGAGALAGSSIFKKNYNEAVKEYSEKMQGKIKPLLSSVDNVSDRDFIIELLSILSILQMHLSRLAEDFILYSTREFNFIDLPEEFCTGSSLLPHKKNPDFLELVRGYTGKVYGNLFSLLTTMKGLPLTYNRDMQLDKEPLFSSVEVVDNELKIMSQFIRKIKLKTDVIDKILEEERTLYATKLVEWLVRKQSVPFKEAHDKVGKVILQIEKYKGSIEKIDEAKLQAIHPSLNSMVIKDILRPK